MIAFAEIHPGWFGTIASLLDLSIIFGLMFALPRIAMNERPEWMEWEL